MYNNTNLKSKQYSRIKSLFVILERSIKYFFYSFIVLISFFKFRAKKKTVLNLGSLEDSRFINFLIFSLKDRFVFSFNLNQNILALIKKIGIKNFLKFFYPRFLLKKKDKILSITLNKKMNSALSEIDFDTDYFSFVTKKKEILKNVNLDIKVGSTIGIIGSSGAGKSTLINILVGLLKPDLGGVFVDNFAIQQNNLRKWQNSIGYVSQEYGMEE